jgi:hypothetical protein
MKSLKKGQVSEKTRYREATYHQVERINCQTGEQPHRVQTALQREVEMAVGLERGMRLG